jgi:hypothetical protein
MIRGFKLFCGIIIFPLLLLNACTSVPKTTEIWLDENYLNSKFNKILVIGDAPKITFRNLFEGELVDQLKKKNIEAIPSYALMQPNTPLSKATVLPIVEKQNIDAVIVSSLIDRKFKKVYYEADSGNVYTYFKGVYGVSKSRPTTHYDVPVLVLKTNLYDVNTEKLVWSITSESEYKYNFESINSAIELIIKSLSQDGLI